MRDNERIRQLEEALLDYVRLYGLSDSARSLLIGQFSEQAHSTKNKQALQPNVSEVYKKYDLRNSINAIRGSKKWRVLRLFEKNYSIGLFRLTAVFL